MLTHFQTLYIYLGFGAIVGAIFGLLLHYSYSRLYKGLRLADQPQSRTIKQYRASRQRKKSRKAVEPSLSPVNLSLSDGPRTGRRGLLTQTILEEEDSEF